MATSLRELIVSVSADTTKYQREMDRASRMGAQYFRSVRDGSAGASRAWEQNTAAVRTHATAVEAGSQALTRYIGVAAGALGAGRIIGMADEWTTITARVRLATESAEELAHVQERLGRIADTTYRSYGEAADQFASTNRMMRELGFETEATLDSAEALGLALVAGGADAQRGATALDAWGKSIAQGRIGTQQWQTLLLQTPRVAQALADGLGKTTVEMTEMAKAGQLTADVAVPALISQMGRLSEEVESMPTEFRDAVQRSANALLVLVGGLNDTYGATATLVRGIEYLVEHLDTVSRIAAGAAIGMLGSRMTLMSAATAKAAVSMVQSRAAAVAEAVAIRDATLAGQLKAQADVRRAQAAMTAARGTAESARATRAYAAALLTERQATIAATQAQAAYARATSVTATAGRAALGILGGPAGLALTIGAVATSWLLFRDSTDDAESALANWTGTAADAVTKFRELNAEQRAGALLAFTSELREAESEVSRIMGGLLTAPGRSTGEQWHQPFREGMRTLREEWQSGAIDADELSRRARLLSDEFLRGTGLTGELSDQYVRLLEQLANSAQEADRKRGTLEQLNGVNSEAERQANATASAIRGQAGALVELGEEAQKATDRMRDAVSRIPGQIERIGQSARGTAHLDVRDWFRQLAADGVNFDDRDNPQVQEYMRIGREYIDLQDQLARRQDQNAASTRALSQAQSDAARKREQEKRAAEQMAERYTDLIAGQERQIALFGDTGHAAAMAYDLARGALQGYSKEQQKALTENAEWLDFLDDMAALDGVWKEVADDHAKYSEDAKKNLSSLEAFADQAARNMQSHLGDSLYNILSGRFDSIADSFGDMLRRMGAELMASQIWRALGTALSGTTGQGWLGNFARSVGGAMQGRTDGGRAGGGVVRPFGAYDVTEHGDPEVLTYGSRQVLLMGSKGGMVSPLMNRAGGGAGAGGPMRVEIVNVGPPVKADRTEHQRGPDGEGLLRVFLSAVAEDVLNGGRVWQATKMRGGLKEAV